MLIHLIHSKERSTAVRCTACEIVLHWFNKYISARKLHRYQIIVSPCWLYWMNGHTSFNFSSTLNLNSQNNTGSNNVNIWSVGSLLCRLKNCFGDRVYSEERSKLIWREVMNQEAKWMTATVDHFISSRQINLPPLPNDFAQAMRDERERDWESGKGRRAREADHFWSQAPAGFFDKIFKKIETKE